MPSRNTALKMMCSGVVSIFLAATATEMKADAFILTHTHVVSKAPINDVFTLHAAEETIDYDDDIIIYPSTSTQAQWDVADDWSKLSVDNVLPKYSPSDFDVMDEAAQILQHQAEFSHSDWEKSDDGSNTTTFPDNHLAETTERSADDFVENAVDTISVNLDYNETGVLYDTIASVNKEIERDHEADEISFMIRCNQTPQQFLIDHGRALPELTDDMKYSPEFLLEKVSVGSDHYKLPLRPKMTPFFQRAVKKMFDTYSVKKLGDEKLMDREALARWMSTSINSPLPTSEQLTIGAHDTSVSAVLSRYSKRHGSGSLTFNEFKDLYLEVTWSAFVRDVRENKAKYLAISKGPFQTPSNDVGVLFQGRRNTEGVLEGASLGLVWRDLEAHGVFSPAEDERVQLLKDMERRVATVTSLNSDLLMDECELFDEYEHRLAHQTYSDENEHDMLGMARDWDLVQKREKSSHELVEMTANGRVPKRIRDGQFCFIDEESCIGCAQCAHIAPSSFKMIEETGRARTFSQSAAIDVVSAVESCPVHCMHMVSFDFLQELEIARDDGDGRTDHRHFGSGKSHKPLHVSRRDSDANHKSSWYHYLKGKCAGSSCPQRGCYDCPKYRPGQNPFFIERHKQFEHIRYLDFLASGEADKWRKVAEL
jgi:ferredoxin